MSSTSQSSVSASSRNGFGRIEAPEGLDHVDADDDLTDAGPTVGFAIGLVFALVGTLIGLQAIGDNSFLTHLQTGRLFLADGPFTTDPYTFTAPDDAPWVIQSWFASVIYATLYNIGGGTALRVFTGVVSAGLAALIWDASRASANTGFANTVLARLAATTPALFLGFKTWSERPLLLGLLFVASLLVVLGRDIDPKVLTPIGLVWVWVHGSFPLGIVVLCALALGTRLDGTKPTKELRALGWFVLGVVVGGIVNPFGPRLLWFPVALLSRREILSSVTEWKPINIAHQPAQLFLISAAVMAVALVRARSFRAAIPGLIFLALAVSSARNMSVASVVFVPIIAAGFAGTGKLADSARPAWAPKLAVVGAAGIICVAGASLATQPTWDAAIYPVEAIDWLEDADYFDTTNGQQPGRLAHTDFTGGYIEFRYNATVPVYIDDRFEFHSYELLYDYLALARGEDDWEASLDRYDLDMVLWLNSDRLADRINESPAWSVEYQDEHWFIACRNNACPSE